MDMEELDNGQGEGHDLDFLEKEAMDFQELSQLVDDSLDQFLFVEATEEIEQLVQVLQSRPYAHSIDYDQLDYSFN